MSLSEITRPIIGIEYRTAQEVFDIMCDRINAARSALPVGGGGRGSSVAGLPASPDGLTDGLNPAGMAVATAAIRIGEAVFTLPRPNRHHNVMWWLSTLGVRSGRMHDQGFVLENGCYVDRKSAAHFANISGQLTKPLIAPPNLFSEDLWDGGADMVLPDVLEQISRGPAENSAGQPSEASTAALATDEPISPPPPTVGVEELAKIVRGAISRAMSAEFNPALQSSTEGREMVRSERTAAATEAAQAILHRLQGGEG